MARTKYRWDEKQKCLVEIGSDWVPTERTVIFTDRYMEGIRAQDGTDIGSRRKRRDYMKSNNLADASDFKGVWEQAAKDRNKPNTADIKEAVAKSIYQLQQRRSR